MTKDRHLLVGVLVEVHRNGELVRSGKVDDVTADSSIIWLSADGPEPRALFPAEEGHVGMD